MNGDTLKDCEIHFLTSKKKLQKVVDNLYGDVYPEYETDIQRFNSISDWVVSNIQKHNVAVVYLEDYAFRATGRVFHIAENTGLLKYKLWKLGIPVHAFPPTTIKKFACGKGNGTKEDMEVAFLQETGYNVKTSLGMGLKQWNPSSDIVDSFYIAKYGKQHKEIQ